MGKKKPKTRVKDMNFMFQIQTLILPLIFWSMIAAVQLKTQALKQVPLGRGACINLQVFATGDYNNSSVFKPSP